MSFNLKKNKFVLTAILIPLLVFLYNFHRDFKGRQLEEISYLNNKIDAIKKELLTPRIDVSIDSFDNLPEEIMSQLHSIPSYIAIKHLKGETAKKLTLDVASSEPIKSFIKKKTLEDFTISFVDKTMKKIRIDIPELRKNAAVEVALFTFKKPELKFNFYADKGELFDLAEEANERDEKLKLLKSEVGYVSLWPFEKLPSKYNSAIISASNTIKEIQLGLLEEKVKQLRNDSMFKSLLRLFVRYPWLIIAFLVIILLLSFWGFKYSGKKEYAKILNKISIGKIKTGDVIYDIINEIGSPFSVEISNSPDKYDLKLNYIWIDLIAFSKARCRLAFKFKDSKLIEIEDFYEGIVLNDSITHS
jgi:hypothetical protein